MTLPTAETRRVWLSGSFFCLYVAIQVVLPTKSLFTPGQQQFSWSMYAGRIERPAFTLQFRDGTSVPLHQLPNRRRVLMLVRAEIDAARFVPPHLCSKLQELEAVIVTGPAEGIENTHPCRH